MTHAAGRPGALLAARRARRATPAVLALALLAAACTGDTDEPVVDATTPATPAPAVSASPAPTPSPSAPAPVSGPDEPVTSRRGGEAGSVADDAGDAPPTPQPGADLRAAEVTLGPQRVRAVLTLDGPPPQRVRSLLWSVQLHVDGQRAYTVTLQQLGEQRTAAVYDWSDREQTPLPRPPAVDGDELTVTVPLELVPRAADGFAWLAHTELNNAWEDWVPSDRRPVEVAP